MLDVVYSAYGYCPDVRNRPLRELAMMLDRIAERNGVRLDTAPLDLAAVAAKYGDTR